MTTSHPSHPLPLPPRSSGLPLIGETFSFLNDPEFAHKRHNQYGNIFRTHLFGRSTVFLAGADAVRFLLLHENQYFVSSWPPSTKALLGPASISTQQGSVHQQRRKLLAQAFQPRVLASYLATMINMTNDYLERWQQQGTITWYPELRNYMKYLEQVLKEVLRVMPPVAGGFREVIQTCEINGYTIPKGWSVLYQISRTHQDSTRYPNPKQFDPERFDVNQTGKSQLFSYVPFGGGMRECLGKEFARLEMKIFAALLIRNSEWDLVPSQNLDVEMLPTPHPKDGLKVYFRRKIAS